MDSIAGFLGVPALYRGMRSSADISRKGLSQSTRPVRRERTGLGRKGGGETGTICRHQGTSFSSTGMEAASRTILEL